MNTYVPNYYKNFKCIADKCRHSCCIGWEIDIDEKSMEYYSSLDGEIGNMLKENISTDNEPHFVLKEGERCPFLKGNGLCHLICELGEDALCNICADHPRFRNFYSNGIEIGLGLCCEAAASLILESVQSFEIELLDGNNETVFDEMEEYVLNRRNDYIDIAKNRNMSFSQRVQLILKDFETVNKSFAQWVDVLLGCERLDSLWTDILNYAKEEAINDFCSITEEGTLIPAEQLLIYFLYRHVPCAIYDGDIASKVIFAVFSTYFINTLYCVVNSSERWNFGIEDIARMYSSEIEYSDNNLESLFLEF